MLPYALLTILMIGYGIFSLTVPMFNSEKLVLTMNKKGAHNHEVIQWINDQMIQMIMFCIIKVLGPHLFKIIIFYFMKFLILQLMILKKL